MRPPAPLVISLFLGTLLWPVRPSAAQLCNSGPVALDARATLQLPPSLGIRGVATGPTGRLALWSSGGEVFSINREHSLTRVQLPDSIRPAGIAITPRGLRLVDQTSGGDFLLSPDGQLISMGRVGLGMAEELDQALWQGDGWILGVRDLATRRFVLRRDRPAGKAVLFRSAQSDSVKTVHRYFLSESGRGLLLTRTTAPFTLIRIGPLDGTVDTLAAALSPATGVTIPADSLANWRALPVVALDCTLLLTLSDLTSDRRLLVRYGADDQVERVTELDVPIGLVTRLPGENAVLAARRTGELELVWYDWHWVREPSSPTP